MSKIKISKYPTDFIEDMRKHLGTRCQQIDFGIFGRPNYENTQQHVSSAVLILIIPKADDIEILLTKRAAHLNFHAGQISFPGGRFEESDKDLLITALRETSEEVGITPNSVSIVGQLAKYYTQTGYAIKPFIGLATNDLELKIDAQEVASVFSIPLKFIENRKNLTTIKHEFAEIEYETYAYQFEDHYIWGATAALLSNLVNLLDGFSNLNQ